MRTYILTKHDVSIHAPVKVRLFVTGVAGILEEFQFTHL